MTKFDRELTCRVVAIFLDHSKHGRAINRPNKYANIKSPIVPIGSIIGINGILKNTAANRTFISSSGLIPMRINTFAIADWS